MEVLFLLVGCSVLVALIFLVAFIWAVKSGQYKDIYTPAIRILFEEPVAQKTQHPNPNQSNN